jgi:hypothetical protein
VTPYLHVPDLPLDGLVDWEHMPDECVSFACFVVCVGRLVLQSYSVYVRAHITVDQFILLFMQISHLFVEFKVL